MARIQLMKLLGMGGIDSEDIKFPIIIGLVIGFILATIILCYVAAVKIIFFI